VSFCNFSANSVKLTPALSNALMFTPIGPSLSTPGNGGIIHLRRQTYHKITFKSLALNASMAFAHNRNKCQARQEWANSLMSLEKPWRNS
jgi:hypothetical protein